MSTDTQALVEICERLSATKRAEVVDFARFLLARERAEAGDDEDDARWEAILASPNRRPKLDAFLEASAKEPAEPMDVERL